MRWEIIFALSMLVIPAAAMAAYVPYPTINATSPLAIFTYGNTVTNDILGVDITLIFWVVTFVAMSRGNDVMASAAAASFLTTLIATALWAGGLINESVIVILIVMTVGSWFFMKRG